MAVTVKEEAGVEVRSGSEGPQAEVGPASIATGEGEELRHRLRDEGGFVVPEASQLRALVISWCIQRLASSCDSGSSRIFSAMVVMARSTSG